MGPRRNKAQRAAAAVAAVMGAVLLMTSTAASQTGAAPAFANGTASATTQGVKVNPTAAALSLGITFGTALAGYTNEVAKAESRGIDLGIIGTTLAGEACDGGEPTLAAERQPQPLAADSRDADAAAGKTAPETFDGQALPGFEKRVRATNQPLAEATTLVVPLGEPGALAIAGVHSTSITRVVDKKTREAVATTEIGSLSVGGGAVKLGEPQVGGRPPHRRRRPPRRRTFTIGSATIGGALLPIPLPTGDPAALFDALNPVLAPFGVELRAPVSREVNGAIQLDPLTIAVVPSPTRDSIAGQLFNAVQPVRAGRRRRPARPRLRQRHLRHRRRHRPRVVHRRRLLLARARWRHRLHRRARARLPDRRLRRAPTTFAGTADEIIPGDRGLVASPRRGGAAVRASLGRPVPTKGARSRSRRPSRRRSTASGAASSPCSQAASCCSSPPSPSSTAARCSPP